jgi:hypothetical protein
VLKTNSLPNLNDQKQFLMLNSLRLVSQMINVFQNQNGEELRDNVLSLSILELVKEGIVLTKDMQPAVSFNENNFFRLILKRLSVYLTC